MANKQFELNGLTYTVRFPRDFDEGKQYPTIFFLHGAGTRWTSLETLEGNAISKYADAHPDFPFVVVMPLCTEETWFDQWAEVKALLAQLQATPWVDASRLYLSGNSMGGYSAWQLAISVPEAFAAIIPVCSGGMYWDAGRLKKIPIWAFHGLEDTLVSPNQTIEMVEQLKETNPNLKYTLYEGVGHASWQYAFSEETLEWLLAQTTAEWISTPLLFVYPIIVETPSGTTVMLPGYPSSSSAMESA
jgi:predicted peptidase